MNKAIKSKFPVYIFHNYKTFYSFQVKTKLNRHVYLSVVPFLYVCLSFSLYLPVAISLHISTVGENIIATIKIRNNYCAIQSFKFPILPLVNLSLLILFASFFVSVLCFFFDGSLLKAIAKRLPLLFANAFKSLKEQQLYGKQYRKEAKNQSTKLIQKFKKRD